MPTARELLEQADALMRRNRAPVEDADIPELTDVVPESAFEFPAAPVVLEDVPVVAPTIAESEAASMPEAIVAESEAASMPEAIVAEGEPSVWLDEAALLDEVTPGEASVTGAAPDSVLAVAPVLPEPASEVAPPSRDEDMARWQALAEEIRMQVLQRIDIFTDTGLKEQLNERLQPVVDRASAELVGTISVHVGQLLRAYVAEAIEREIEKWRAGEG